MASQAKSEAEYEVVRNADDSPYDNLGSPTFETAQAAGETTGDAPQTPEEKEQQMQEWREELARVEGEIVTLKQVLGSKVRFAAELKRKLGISPLQEFKQDFSEGLRTIKESETYQKTSAAAKTAAEKTTALATAVGQSVSKKIGDIRNSQTFKSMEGRIESTVATVKSKVVGSKSEGDFEEALKSDQAGNGAAPTVTEQPKTLPEEKVPL